MTEDLVSPKRLAFIYLYCNMKCFQMFPIYQSLSLKQTIRHLLQRQQQWLILANFGCQAGLQLPTAHQDDASHLGCNLPLPWLIFSPFLYFSALETFSSRIILCVHSKCFNYRQCHLVCPFKCLWASSSCGCPFKMLLAMHRAENFIFSLSVQNKHCSDILYIWQTKLKWSNNQNYVTKVAESCHLYHYWKPRCSQMSQEIKFQIRSRSYTIGPAMTSHNSPASSPVSTSLKRVSLEPSPINTTLCSKKRTIL